MEASGHGGRRALADEALTGLHVLADDDPRLPHDPVEQASRACEGGASVVQLRAKQATDSRVLEWGERIRALTRDANVTFFVNDRFDLALLLDADGVHLGQGDLPPDALPEAARKRLRIGRSTHDVAQARRALREGVDYVAFGPVFETGSKDTGYTARGLPALAEIAEIVSPLPVVAIGGIDAERAARACEAGARGVAVISAVAAIVERDEAVASVRRLARACRGGGE
ncbi:MAG: thiamine phosphate synthase [Myxococcota bacterium]|nr:thiamine phosphate synthase [Myxococcota bacterium]